jgi:glycosyltransferase involved in cell wall biosynthesis
MKLACVIHRFGADFGGGSEAHCRQVAGHLAATHDVTIVTSCARDHVTWKNHYPAGESFAGALRVRRFPVARSRNLVRFREISDHVFAGRATAGEQEQWFRENGPETPALIEFLGRHGSDYDIVLFWTYRYYHTYFGLPLVADRAVLVPTAEDDPLVHIDALRPLFSVPIGYIFLTPEEAELLARRVPPATPSCIIGCGIDPPRGSANLERVREAGVAEPFALYLGRIDPNKGCETLLHHFQRYVRSGGPGRGVQLVMAGSANMPMPDHPSVRVLGFVDDAMREALLSKASVLLMPSPFESLSMVLLEAWNHGVPALVNARCHVLRGQILRADGGLYYRTAMEFAGALDFLLGHAAIARRLGEQGRGYVDREYRWPTVMTKIERFLAEVAGGSAGGWTQATAARRTHHNPE